MNPEISKNDLEQVPSEKQTMLDMIAEEVDSFRDDLDRPIDAEIRDTLIYLKGLGLETWQSCGGHWEEDGEDRCDAPYVIFEALNRPKQQYRDEEKILQQFAEKHSVTIEAMKDAESEEAIRAYNDAYDNGMRNKVPEAKEYKEWFLRSKKMFETLKQFLSEFYEEREIDPETQLIVGGSEDSNFRLTNQAGVYEESKYDPGYFYSRAEVPVDTDSDLNREKVSHWREEMQAFTEFLKGKFLKE